MKFKLGCLFILISYSFHAQEIITDRPDQTESAIVIPKSSLQIEMGAISGTSNDRTIKTFAGPSTLIRYSLSKAFELRVFNQFESIRVDLDGDKIESKGLSDFEIGFKTQILKMGKTNIAFLSHIILPTANDELSNKKIGIINKLCISNQLNDDIGLGYNIGYEFVGEMHAFTYSLAVGFPLFSNFGMYIEPYGSLLEGGLFESNFDLGLTYLIVSNFQLDLSYGTGLNNDMQYVSAGFSWNITSFLK